MRATTFFMALSLAAAGTLGKLDSTFVTKAAQGGLAEVKLGQLAQDKGSNQSVKDFGAQKDRVEDVAEFRKESKTAQDADIKSFAATTLPTLEHHLQMAQDAQKQLGATSRK